MFKTFDLDLFRQVTADKRVVRHENIAVGLLKDLGYLDSGQSPADALQQAVPYFALAAGCDELFKCRMPFAPGAIFIGALMRPSRFGFECGTRAVSVGGRGLTMRPAFESCMGEAAEYLSFLRWPCDPLIEDFGQGEGVFAVSIATQQKVVLDVNKVLRDPAGSFGRQSAASSSGLAAGESPAAAKEHALLELVERDAFHRWWWQGRKPRKLALTADERHELETLIARVRMQRFRKSWFLDLCTENGIPVVAALSSNNDGTSVVAGFAASSTALSAAKKAFMELVQTEFSQWLAVRKSALLAEQSLDDADRQWVKRHSELSLCNYPLFVDAAEPSFRAPWPYLDAFSSMSKRLIGMGHELYAVDLTRKGIDIPTIKLIAQGLLSNERPATQSGTRQLPSISPL